jgi:serine phosphatase RsbU (regulator of sigma subunit)
MKSRLKRRKQKRAHAIEAVDAGFPVLRNAEIAAAVAGRRKSGDFYDSIRVSPSRVLFGLLDLADRRKQHEELRSKAQRVFREVGGKLLRDPEANESEALAELCLQLNRSIIETASSVHSSPAFAGCYNEYLGTVCYFNAGHTPGLVLHATDVSELAATGLPLGLFSHTTSDSQMIVLEPGAALLLVSRAVVEAKRQGEEFGLHRVEETLRSARPANAHELCALVLDAMHRFAPAEHEDTTALALIRSVANEATPSGPG